MRANHKSHSLLLSVLLWAFSLLPAALSAQVLIPMDESQQRDHLKAYGLIAIGY
jgi:hypothetical protein